MIMRVGHPCTMDTFLFLDCYISCIYRYLVSRCVMVFCLFFHWSIPFIFFIFITDTDTVYTFLYINYLAIKLMRHLNYIYSDLGLGWELRFTYYVLLGKILFDWKRLVCDYFQIYTINVTFYSMPFNKSDTLDLPWLISWEDLMTDYNYTWKWGENIGRD